MKPSPLVKDLASIFSTSFSHDLMQSSDGVRVSSFRMTKFCDLKLKTLLWALVSFVSIWLFLTSRQQRSFPLLGLRHQNRRWRGSHFQRRRTNRVRRWHFLPGMSMSCYVMSCHVSLSTSSNKRNSSMTLPSRYVNVMLCHVMSCLTFHVVEQTEFVDDTSFQVCHVMSMSCQYHVSLVTMSNRRRERSC